MTEPARPRTAAMWSLAFDALTGSPWEETDACSAAQASPAFPDVDLYAEAAALRAAYHGPLKQEEDIVHAALIACARVHGGRSPRPSSRRWRRGSSAPTTASPRPSRTGWTSSTARTS